MTEFSTTVPLRDIAVRDTDVSSAVDQPARATILDMLAERERTVAELHAELADRGFDRTENTIRHHVNELRDAGLLEVSRLEERRGGTTKYYRANTIVLSYRLPDGSEDVVDEMVAHVRPQVADLVEDLEREFSEELATLAAEMSPCEHCQTQKYETYVLLTVLRRAFVSSYARDAAGDATP
jgi:DNA-binding transcriptional ArsR family regulator